MRTSVSKLIMGSPEELPLDVCLSEDAVISVHHSGAQHAQQHNEGDELGNHSIDIPGKISQIF